MKNIIKTDDYLLIVSDEEIEEGDWFTDDNNSLKRGYKLSHVQFANPKKIIAHLSLNNSSILEGVDLLPPLEDEPKGFDEYEYTEDDMIEYSNWLFKWCEYNKYRKLIDGVKPYGVGEFISDKDMFEKFSKEKSHQQPKYPIGFESEEYQELCLNCEWQHDSCPNAEDCLKPKPKTTTNSQGQTVLEGKYIYE